MNIRLLIIISNNNCAKCCDGKMIWNNSHKSPPQKSKCNFRPWQKSSPFHSIPTALQTRDYPACWVAYLDQPTEYTCSVVTYIRPCTEQPGLSGLLQLSLYATPPILSFPPTTHCHTHLFTFSSLLLPVVLLSPGTWSVDPGAYQSMPISRSLLPTVCSTAMA